MPRTSSFLLGSVQKTHQKVYLSCFSLQYSHFDHVSERQWGLILELKKEAAHDGDDDVGVDESMISAYHGDLYIPLSPKKARIWSVALWFHHFTGPRIHNSQWI